MDDTEIQQLILNLRGHVHDRGGARMENGAWTMMLQAATALEFLMRQNEKLEAECYSMFEQIHYNPDE